MRKIAAPRAGAWLAGTSILGKQNPGTKLAGTQIPGTRFRGAHQRGAQLDGARLTGAGPGTPPEGLLVHLALRDFAVVELVGEQSFVVEVF